MFEEIKNMLLVWSIIFLMIFAVLFFLTWIGASIWWLLTNVMLDRYDFLFFTLTLSLGVSCLTILLSLISDKK